MHLQADVETSDGGAARVHFACASVLQLLEGHVLSSIMHTLPPEAVTELQVRSHVHIASARVQA
jgi:hypothetical protein